jgi:tRNA nucleotidyltransferase (CCA-adding enzyme)
MRIYRVGGAVRDMLLGREPKDFDFVVVGATTEEFLRTFPNAKAVGKSFPVYQVVEHGATFEYAFARRERKVALGHQGFEVESDPSVTLEEDLYRRDLTINALALPLVYRNNVPLEAQVIDVCGGLKDLRSQTLRHVSEHFVEDPLRVYRLTRFTAQLGFNVAPETSQLCWTIPREELFALSGERVGEETRKAMRSGDPVKYFETLRDIGGLGPWFPELLQLVGTPAGPPKYHQELDSFVHTMWVLDYFTFPENTVDLNPDLDLEVLRWAALTHDLGKGVTPRDKWPSHPGHDAAGVPLVQRFCDRLRLPTYIKDACIVACAEHMKVHIFLEMRSGKWVDMVRRADRTRLQAEGLAVVAMADSLGRKADEKDISGPRALHAAIEPCREATGHPILASLTGEAIGLHIRRAKGTAISKILKEKGYL